MRVDGPSATARCHWARTDSAAVGKDGAASTSIGGGALTFDAADPCAGRKAHSSPKALACAIGSTAGGGVGNCGSAFFFEMTEDTCAVG